MNKKIIFCKSVGGYFTLVKWKNRWHYAHDSGKDHLDFINIAKANGFILERISGDPIQYLKKGMVYTISSFKKNYPIFNNEWMKGE